MSSENRLIVEARAIIEAAWHEAMRSPYVQAKLGNPLTRLPDLSCAEADRRSSVGRSLLGHLERLDLDTLPHSLALTLRLVKYQARIWSREAQWYWTVIDPLGIGEFGLFLPTAYCGGYLLSYVHKQFASFTFAEPADVDRYLALVEDYARVIDQFTERTAGQAALGMRVPRVQIPSARLLLRNLKSAVGSQLTLALRSSTDLELHGARQRVAHCIAARVEPALDRAIAQLSNQYYGEAGDNVGMSQYPGGQEIYAELVNLHTTLNLTPEQVLRNGTERMAEIEESIAAVQAKLGFAGNPSGFMDRLHDDPRWRAGTVEEVSAVFQRYLDRLEPRMGALFTKRPAAECGVAPLPEMLQSSMTYGYYDPPKPGRMRGVYYFNAANLTNQPLYRLGSLAYHELMPGHHLQFAMQLESSTMHPLQANSLVMAYVEGWAEYAATLAGESGLYEAPEERYGRLVMDAFLTSRLVVDPGMNALGWSLNRGQAYMRKHSRLTEDEIASETVRYSCDIPGQALAYKIGDRYILTLRERMQSLLPHKFSLASFHEAILACGPLPLSDLEWHLNHVIQHLEAGAKDEPLAAS